MAWNCSRLFKRPCLHIDFPSSFHRVLLDVEGEQTGTSARVSESAWERRWCLRGRTAVGQVRVSAGSSSYNKALFRECCLEPLASAHISQHTWSWQMWLPYSQAEFCATWQEYVKCFLKINESFAD